MSFTTSGGLRMTWRLADLDPAVFASMAGCSRAEADKRFARVRDELRDPAAARAMLGQLSVPALAVLCVLVGAGGAAGQEELVDQVGARFGIEAPQVKRALIELTSALLVVLLSSGRRELAALVDVAAGAVSELAGGLDVPAVDDALGVISDPSHDDGRGLIATCMALRHVEVKVTQTGAPHRSATKRLAKQLGVPERAIEVWLDVALDLALVRAEQHDVLRPVVPRIIQAAAGRFPHRPELEAFLDLLRANARPVVFQAAAKWLYEVSRSGVFPFRLGPAELASLPGVRRGRAGAVDVLEASALPDAVAATITPSFEVYLPPECALAHVIDALGCAELVRIDRVLVARITKPSIRRAVAAGATAASIVASLAGACRTPLPQNIEASIVDWAGSATHATVAFGQAIAVSPEAHERAAAALASIAPITLAPGVFVARPQTLPGTIAKLLDKAGITVCTTSGEDDDADDLEVADPPRRAARAYPALVTGDRAFQARLAAFRAGDPAERARIAKPTCSCGKSHDDDDEHDDDDQLTVSDAAVARVERWERAHQRLPDELAPVLAAVTDAFAPADRDFVLLAKTEQDLIARMRIVLAERGGLERFASVHTATFARVLPAVIDALSDPDADDDADDDADEDVDDDVDDDADDDLAGSGVRQDAFAGQRIDWIRHGIEARLTEAHKARSTVLLDLGDGLIRIAKIEGLRRQGSVMMLLAENQTDRSGIAVPIDAVRAIAEPPAARRAAGPSTPSSRAPWRPLPGQPVPAGHVACPCGSGQRYRSCCRDAGPPS